MKQKFKIKKIRKLKITSIYCSTMLLFHYRNWIYSYTTALVWIYILIIFGKYTIWFFFFSLFSFFFSTNCGLMFAINDRIAVKRFTIERNTNIRAIIRVRRDVIPVQADLAFERHRASFIDVFSASCHGRAGIICSKCVIIKTVEYYAMMHSSNGYDDHGRKL